MACSCLSDDTWFALSQMRTTTTLQVEDPQIIGPNSPGMPEYCLEKVFPVYAVGVSEPDPNLIVSVANTASTLGDPIWDAVKLEAKLEVCFFILLFLTTVYWPTFDAFTRIKHMCKLYTDKKKSLLGFEPALHIVWPQHNCFIQVNSFFFFSFYCVVVVAWDWIYISGTIAKNLIF